MSCVPRWTISCSIVNGFINPSSRIQEKARLKLEIVQFLKRVQEYIPRPLSIL